MKNSTWIVIGVVVLALLVGWYAYSKGYFGGYEAAPSPTGQTQTRQNADQPDYQVQVETQPEGVTATGTAKITTEQNPVVNMTDSGFTPTTLTVKEGQTVVFHNAGSNPIWPASAKHPEHAAYSGTTLTQHCPDQGSTSFDACKGIQPGQNWSFKFDKGGTWAYHDHLNPAHFGKITVQ